MANPFTYCELHTSDSKQAADFYNELFDWKLQTSDSPVGPYTMIETGGTGGGMMQRQDSRVPSAWMVYISVDDVARATEKAKGLGATVQMGKTEVKGHGWFSVLTDPTGATFALWENTGKQ